MAERIVEEIVIAVRVDVSGEASASVAGAGTSGAVKTETPGAGDIFAKSLAQSFKSFAFGQINQLFRQTLSSLFGLKKRTITSETRSFRGGDSQFGPLGEHGSTASRSATTGGGALRSPVQSSADITAILAKGQRNS